MKGWENSVGKHSRTSAFTIVELLIVIVIIGILAAIVIVGYGAVVKNANDTALKDDISKLGDVIKLVTLDNNGIPDGGANSSNTGQSDPSILNGVHFQPTVGSYDLTVANLYYCSGSINGTKEFTIVARSKSGNAFSYSSKGGLANFGGYTWTNSNDGTTVCGLAGYTAPFTWSYGYSPTSNYGWFAWAFNGAILTNLATNPSFEADTAGWFNYTGLNAALTRVTSGGWSGSSYISSVGDNSSTTPRMYTDIPTANGDTIAISFRVKSTGQAATNGFIAAKLIASGSEVSTFYTNSVAWAPDSNGWSLVTATFTVPTGGDHVRLSLGLTSTVNYTGTMGLDALIAVKSATVPTYADGNTPRWSWTGATNDSTSTGPAL